MVMYFESSQNRSERAKQVQLLVPVLDDVALRTRLFESLDLEGDLRITPEEMQNARVMHFVWVLRDTFTTERDAIFSIPDVTQRPWATFINRWTGVLSLPTWANQLGWWRHPSGEFKGDPNYVVHPCHRLIGWATEALKRRAANFTLDTANGLHFDELISARMTLNTECDCLIQTSRRLIVIECKDKTNFNQEQSARQTLLRGALSRLLPRPVDPLYLEVDSERTRKTTGWSWEQLEKIRIT